ncbi:hypothetical protein SNE26_23750 [Mucilaginibacter sp. cycad4]|jgi:hypothetical protein|nr:hypothetical protein [Mucilaginibacter gossypii]WPU99031.1 hypothetical protein SNE26_23750 [Mucilaginibacter gossypii]
MKTQKQTSTTKLIATFDNALKNIIMSDLKAIKTKTPYLTPAA